MTAPHLTVTYGLDAAADLIARDADRALEGTGARVWYIPEDDSVWINNRNAPVNEAVRFRPGQTLVVSRNEGWYIEPAPVVTA